MRLRGFNSKNRSILHKIAREELVEGVREVLEIKSVNSHEKIYKIVVRIIDDDGKTYLAHAIVKLTPEGEDYWKLINYWLEEV